MANQFRYDETITVPATTSTLIAPAVMESFPAASAALYGDTEKRRTELGTLMICPVDGDIHVSFVGPADADKKKIVAGEWAVFVGPTLPHGAVYAYASAETKVNVIF